VSAHTPTPWLIHEDGVFIYALNEDSTNRFTISTQRGFVRQPKNGNGERTSMEELKANAHLIAAAPELLEAVQNLINTAKYGTDGMGYKVALTLAEEVIAKATGRATA